MNTHTNNDHELEQKPIEKAVIDLQGNVWQGILFMLSLVPIIFLRKRIGIRIIKVEIITLMIFCLIVIALLADFISSLPFGANLSFATWKLFIIMYSILSVIQYVNAYLETKKPLFTYSRSLGSSLLYPLFSRLNISFINSERRFQAYVEPVIVFLISRVVSYFLAANLGLFLAITSLALLFVGQLVHNAENNWKFNINDSKLMAQKMSNNVKDTREHDVSETASFSGNQKRRGSSDTNGESVVI